MERRALTFAEQELLLAEAYYGPERYGVSGQDRALLYLVALETGLRANELRSLTSSCFSLASEPATVTVRAGYSKRRREDEIPLRPDTAGELRRHLNAKSSDAPAFRLPPKYEMADMLRADLAAARQAWIEKGQTEGQKAERANSSFLAETDAAGRVVDFHALRHTFISNLARSGVHPKMAQDLARHCDINLTLGRYTHTTRGELSQALETPPSLSPASKFQPQQVSRTLGAAELENLAFCLALSDAQACTSMHSDAQKDRGDDHHRNPKISREKPQKDGAK